MSGRVSDYQVTQWLTGLQSGTWLGLHFDNPDVAGAYASEVFGSGYARQSIDFSFPDARAMWNRSQISFSGMPPVTITHLGLWDSGINGNLLASISLDVPIRSFTGKTVSFAPDTIAVSLD